MPTTLLSSPATVRWQAVVEVAGRQQGRIGRWQLEALEVDKHRRRSLVRRGLLVPHGGGVHAVAGAPVTPHATAMAAVLRGGADAHLAEDGAAWLWGWRRRWPARPTLLVPRGARSRQDEVRICFAELPARDRTRQHGIPVTTPLRTVVDCATCLDGEELDRVVAAALVSPHVRLRTLEARVREQAGRPGTPALREVLQVSEMAVTRSEAERMLRRAILDVGVVRPQFNVRVLGRERDAVWYDLKLVVEVQGYRFHSDPRQFEDDHQRALTLTAAGWLHVPVSYRMLRFHRATTMVRLGEVVAARAEALRSTSVAPRATEVDQAPVSPARTSRTTTACYR